MLDCKPCSSLTPSLIQHIYSKTMDNLYIYESIISEVIWKHCNKRRDLSSKAISPSAVMFSNVYAADVSKCICV